MRSQKKKSRVRSISETNPVFTMELDCVRERTTMTRDIEKDSYNLQSYLNPAPKGDDQIVEVDTDHFETDSGYESSRSPRKISTCSAPLISALSVASLNTAFINSALKTTGARKLSQTSVSFSENLSEADEFEPPRSQRSPSVGSGIYRLGGRRVSQTTECLPEILAGNTESLKRGELKSCPSDRCVTPILCENFKRGPSLGFRHVPKRERRYSSCSITNESDGMNVSLHNIIGKKGTGKGQFRNATSVSHVSSGSIIVTDIINCRVTHFHGSGRIISEIETGPGSEPWATAVLPNGNLVVSLQKPGSLAIFNSKGEYCNDIASHLLVKPSGVATDRKGRIIVSDVNTDAVYILNEDGDVLKGLGQEPDVPLTFEEPRYVDVTYKDKILVCDSGKHCVYVFDSDGNFLHKFGSYGQEPGQFRFPYGITSDFEENIYVADHYNNRVSMFSISGEFLCHILTPCMKLKRPQGLNMKDGITDSILFVTHGEMKAQEVVAFKIIMGSKPRLQKSLEVHV